jgi:hypothetical protein
LDKLAPADGWFFGGHDRRPWSQRTPPAGALRGATHSSGGHRAAKQGSDEALTFGP